MALSNDLLSQFAKATTSKKKEDTETTVYGTVVDYDGKYHVRLDGSDRLTPMPSLDGSDGLTPMPSNVEAKPGERVAVQIKNHSATITGNMSAPAVRVGTVEEIAGETSVYISNLEGNILEYQNGTIKNFNAINASIVNLRAENGKFHDLVTENLEAKQGKIDELEAKMITVDDLDVKYANINFANIGEAAFKKLFSDSGLIKDLVVGDQTITGHLVGVTISGDLIEGNTIAAEKLVVKGEDGLYYKLNITERGVTPEEYDAYTDEEKAALQSGLHGDNIIARTITAEKVSVTDLVAFDAKLANFSIGLDENGVGSLYSGVKESVDNTTEGVYFDSDGQMNVGGTSQYLKYYKNDDGTYKLEIRASSILLGSSGDSLEDTLISIDDKFETLIKDENGKSLMTQDGDGWTFDISNIRDSANAALDRTDTLSKDMDTTSAKIDELDKDVDTLHKLSEYVRVSTYTYVDDDGISQTEPCLELGETDSDFKHRITNTRDEYLTAYERKTYIDKDGITTDNIKVENDFAMTGKIEVTDDGDHTYITDIRYVWKVRLNGNCGLTFDGWLG